MMKSPKTRTSMIVMRKVSRIEVCRWPGEARCSFHHEGFSFWRSFREILIPFSLAFLYVEDEEWEERLRILEDTRRLKQVAGFFLLSEHGGQVGKGVFDFLLGQLIVL